LEDGGSEGVRRVVLVLVLLIVLVLVDGRGRMEGSVEEGREKLPARLERRLLGFEMAPPKGLGEPRPCCSAAVAKEAEVLMLSVDWLRLWAILRSISRRVSGVSGVAGGIMSSCWDGWISLIVAVGPLAVDTEEIDSVSQSLPGGELLCW
jgi:hypothetical protein